MYDILLYNRFMMQISVSQFIFWGKGGDHSCFIVHVNADLMCLGPSNYFFFRNKKNANKHAKCHRILCVPEELKYHVFASYI